MMASGGKNSAYSRMETGRDITFTATGADNAGRVKEWYHSVSKAVMIGSI
jgi:hypothetical protein